MKYAKICPYCKCLFTTDKRAKKFCRSRCAQYFKKTRKKRNVRQICQWCGQIFEHERVKKFCSMPCRQAYMKRLGIEYRRTVKIPVKVTLIEADRESKAEGVTYGTYITLHKLR